MAIKSIKLSDNKEDIIVTYNGVIFYNGTHIKIKDAQGNVYVDNTYNGNASTTTLSINSCTNLKNFLQRDFLTKRIYVHVDVYHGALTMSDDEDFEIPGLSYYVNFFTYTDIGDGYNYFFNFYYSCVPYNNKTIPNYYQNFSTQLHTGAEIETQDETEIILKGIPQTWRKYNINTTGIHDVTQISINPVLTKTNGNIVQNGYYLLGAYSDDNFNYKTNSDIILTISLSSQNHRNLLLNNCNFFLNIEGKNLNASCEPIDTNGIKLTFSLSEQDKLQILQTVGGSNVTYYSPSQWLTISPKNNSSQLIEGTIFKKWAYCVYLNNSFKNLSCSVTIDREYYSNNFTLSVTKPNNCYDYDLITENISEETSQNNSYSIDQDKYGSISTVPLFYQSVPINNSVFTYLIEGQETSNFKNLPYRNGQTTPTFQVKYYTDTKQLKIETSGTGNISIDGDDLTTVFSKVPKVKYIGYNYYNSEIKCTAKIKDTNNNEHTITKVFDYDSWKNLKALNIIDCSVDDSNNTFSTPQNNVEITVEIEVEIYTNKYHTINNISVSTATEKTPLISLRDGYLGINTNEIDKSSYSDKVIVIGPSGLNNARNKIYLDGVSIEGWTPPATLPTAPQIVSILNDAGVTFSGGTWS